VAGPLPTNFRWLWYLVGLAGFGLMVVGLAGILGSAWDLGILIPVVVFIAIVVVAGLLWFRRSLNAAVAAAPSRQGSGAGGTARAGAPASSDAAAPGTQDPETPSAGGVSSGSEAVPPSRPTPKPPATPRRTSRRGP
jgi:hypothetical protein